MPHQAKAGFTRSKKACSIEAPHSGCEQCAQINLPTLCLDVDIMSEDGNPHRQRMPMRRLTAGRLRVITSERANHRYAESCLAVPPLDRTKESNAEASVALVPADRAQEALCIAQTVEDPGGRSLAAFCSKRMLLLLRQSMQPYFLPRHEELCAPDEDTQDRPSQGSQGFSKLEIPIFEDCMGR